MATGKPITPLAQDVLDNRLRLIGREDAEAQAAKAAMDRAAGRWVKELRRMVRSGDRSKAGLARIGRLSTALRKLGRITQTEYRSVRAQFVSTARATYRTELLRHAEILNTHVLSAEGTASVSFDEIHTGAVDAALSGTITGLDQMLGRAARGTQAALKKDLADAIANGYSVDQLSDKWGQSKGAVGLGKSQLDSLARTNLMAASNNAALAQYGKAPRVIRAVQWEATFDTRTCVRCAALHGRVFPVGKAPPMPAHFRCRCTWLPVFYDQSINQKFDTQQAYIRPDGSLAFRKSDRRFDTWLKAQPVPVQRTFFPSNLKYDKWQSGVPLEKLVNPDGTIKTDQQVRGLKPTRPRIKAPKSKATENLPPGPPREPDQNVRQALTIGGNGPEVVEVPTEGPPPDSELQTFIDRVDALPRVSAGQAETPIPIDPGFKVPPVNRRTPSSEQVVPLSSISTAQGSVPVRAVKQALRNGIDTPANPITVVRNVAGESRLIGNDDARVAAALIRNDQSVFARVVQLDSRGQPTARAVSAAQSDLKSLADILRGLLGDKKPSAALTTRAIRLAERSGSQVLLAAVRRIFTVTDAVWPTWLEEYVRRLS